MVALVLLCLGVLWFIGSYERRSELEWEPPSPQARQDRFLAAARLLQRLGVPARSIEGLEGDLAAQAGAVIVLPARRGVLSMDAQTRLLKFIDDGAHLIIESEAAGGRDQLLDALQIERKEISNTEQLQIDNPSWREKSRSLDRDSRSLIAAPWAKIDGRPLQVTLHGFENLKYAGTTLWRMRKHKQLRALHFVRGQGRITVVNDIRFASNWILGANDNAEFLWRLVNLGGKPPEVIFLQPRSAGLLAWLQIYAWRPLLILGLLILACLWAMGPRFGPLRADPEPVRRRLLDHLRASGRLLWSQGARAELARAARASACERLLREYPHLRTQPAAERVNFLMQRFALSRAQAIALTGEQAPTEAAAFITLVRAARQLHAKLRHVRAATDPTLDVNE